MAEQIDVDVDRALGIASEPAAPAAVSPLVLNRDVFDEQVRQQREILALQREAHLNLIESMRAEQATILSVLEKFGLAELRAHVKSEFHGAGHGLEPSPTREDGFLF